MAEIYLLNIKTCGDVLSSLGSRVSEKRRNQVQRVKNGDAALRCIASEVLLSFSLKCPLPVVYKTESGGKPFISTLPFFNISHSSDWVICAVSNKPVGVDIERTDRMKVSLSRHILSEEEYRRAQTASGASLQELLCEKWVRKESYLKMTGEGLRRSMTSLCFNGSELDGESVFSKVFDFPDGCKIAFCRREKADIKLIDVLPCDLYDYFELNKDEK